MWTNKELKTRAKVVLKTNYWKSFAISLAIAFSSFDIGISRKTSTDIITIKSIIEHIMKQYHYQNYTDILVACKNIFIASIFIIIALKLLIGYPLEVGGRKYYISAAQYKENKGCIRFAYNKKNFKGILLTMLLRRVYLTAWTLLFIIPGIVQSYAYRMVPYILADNPNIGADRAIKLSIDMMKGQKLDLFVLDLSYIGWYFLGVLVLLIGVIFVNPYSDATEAELYLVLKKNAIENNYCSYEELDFDEVNLIYFKR